MIYYNKEINQFIIMTRVDDDDTDGQQHSIVVGLIMLHVHCALLNRPQCYAVDRRYIWIE